MAKKTKKVQAETTAASESLTVMAYAAELIFDQPNPRFAGMTVGNDDPTPYLDRMDKMADSMIECYQKTGQLLLQPIVAIKNDDGTLSVRAGFTRAMTFLHKYDYITNALGVDILKIAVSVFDELSTSESLMENMVRSEQHFMSIAHSLKTIIEEQQKPIGKIAKQLGMGLPRAKNLLSIASMIPELQHLCYDQISEVGATVFATLSAEQQAKVHEYIVENEIVVSDADDAESIVRRALDYMPDYVPVEAFSHGGYDYPHLSEEEWCVPGGELFVNFFCTDREAADERTKAYWTMIADTHELEVLPSSDYYNKVNYNHTQVPMGTHPNEFAIWDNYKPVIKFFIKDSEWEKLQEDYKDTQVSKINDLAQTKAMNLRIKAKMSLMRELLDKVGHSGKMEAGTKALLSFVISRLNDREIEKVQEIMGQNINRWKSDSIDGLDMSELSNAISFALLYNSFQITSDIKDYLSHNGVDFDKEWKAKQKEIDKEEKELLLRAEDRGKDAEDVFDAKEEFLKEITNIFCIDGYPQSLYDRIVKGKPTEKELKYVCKKLGLPYKGSVALMAMRTANTINYMVKVREMEDAMVSEHQEKFDKLIVKVRESVTYFRELVQGTKDVTGETLQTVLRHAVSGIRSEFGGEPKVYDFGIELDEIRYNVFDIKPIIKHANNALGNSTNWLEETGETLAHSLVEFLYDQLTIPFKALYLKDQKKLRILG